MMRQPVTYLEIHKWVYRRHGFIPNTCWIAHCKELCGLPLGRRALEAAKQKVRELFGELIEGK
jgi:hypothetical protein